MKFLQVVFFLAVSWGMFSVVFAYQEQRDHNDAVWYLTNAMTIPEPELAEACRKAWREPNAASRGYSGPCQGRAG